MADEETLLRDQRDATMQRVRVGLTGLAAVFLLTLLAASIFSLLGQDEPHGAKLARGGNVANVASAEDLPKEPLAELGIAPGGNLPKAADKQAAPAPAAAPSVASGTMPAHPGTGPAPRN
jgi:hypothetical protein